MCWCCYLYFTTCGEKIYINQVVNLNKIKGLRHLLNAYLQKGKGENEKTIISFTINLWYDY